LWRRIQYREKNPMRGAESNAGRRIQCGEQNPMQGEESLMLSSIVEKGLLAHLSRML
jgi:hypothetical protein